MSATRALRDEPPGILITGASGGIGAALARLYAGPGTVLCLAGRDEKRLSAVAEQCRHAGATVTAALVDVGDAASMRRLIEEFDAAAPLGLVIANAGISSGRRPSGEPEPWSAVQRIFAVNVMGTLNTIHPAIERMRGRRCGQIAIVGSLAGWRGLASCPAYSASKAAIETYGEALRGSLAADGIGVTIVSPGYVASPMSDRVIGPKPFLVGAERAARIIRRGLERRRPRIAFPLPMRIGAALLTVLPCRLADRAASAFSFRIAPDGDEA